MLLAVREVMLPESLQCVILASGAAAYAVLFRMDVSSTVRFGRDTVGTSEYSPVFRVMVRRHGVRVAVLCQVLLELALVFCVVPLLIVHEFNIMISGTTLFLCGMFHYAGYRSNAA